MPNLLFLFTDEQRFDTMACYGNEAIAMPNLNHLAGQSCILEQAYVTQPVCTPSRASLMTGQWPHTCGCTENNVPLPPETACLPEMLPEGEYACGYHGKWHLGDEIFAQHGYTDWQAIDDGYHPWYSKERDPSARSAYHWWLVDHGIEPGKGNRFGRSQVADLPEELSKPAFLAQTAEHFIEQHRQEPWVLTVNFFEPHMPFTGPRDEQYDPAAIPLPRNFDHLPGEMNHPKYRLFREHYRRHGCGSSPAPLDNEVAWRTLIARYWGLCSQVDAAVGRVLKALRRSGQEDDTIIVYTSDHGDMMGSHQLVAKCVMYEEATRVPWLIRLPGQAAQRRIPQPVSQIDMVPTLLDLLGRPRPEHLQGHSLRDVLEGRAEQPGRDVFIEWNGPNCGLGADVIGEVKLPPDVAACADRATAEKAILDPLRTVVAADGWKLTLSPDLGRHELYNLRDDPLETTNLADRPDMKPRMRDLANRIRDWQEQTCDRVELPPI
jgi:arylsulfatase A-like enzyme